MFDDSRGWGGRGFGPILYVLNDRREPVAVADAIIWATWKIAEERKPNRGLLRVGLDRGDGWMVSTVFLGIDTSLGSVPILFETMVETSDGADFRRYATWAQAEVGHAEEVERLRTPR